MRTIAEQIDDQKARLTREQERLRSLQARQVREEREYGERATYLIGKMFLQAAGCKWNRISYMRLAEVLAQTAPDIGRQCEVGEIDPKTALRELKNVRLPEADVVGEDGYMTPLQEGGCGGVTLCVEN